MVSVREILSDLVSLKAHMPLHTPRPFTRTITSLNATFKSPKELSHRG